MAVESCLHSNRGLACLHAGDLWSSQLEAAIEFEGQLAPFLGGGSATLVSA